MTPEPGKEKTMKRFDQRARNAKFNRMVSRMVCVLLLLGAAVLSGCAAIGIGGTSAGGATNVPAIGPQLSSNQNKTEAVLVDDTLPKLDVVVPVFDPNLPEDSDTWKKRGIYPELRRAEANRFALKMKSALEDTKAFDTVRVVPSSNATADLYVTGKILQSNGEDVGINITATDISGKEWFTKDFNHRVKEAFHGNQRNRGKDPYTPVFEKAAAYVVKKLQKYDAEQLAKLQQIAELRFGSSLSEETFSRYLKVRAGRVELAAAPADDDPMLQRIRPIRVRDQLFIDRMQTHYADFDQKLNESYLVWQEQSLVEINATRKANRKSVAQGIIGGLLLFGGLVAAIEGDNPLDPSASKVVGGAAAAVAGAVVLGQSFQNRAEMKVHRDALAELGNSIDIEVAPQVVEYENETAKLVGDASEQYQQWVAFLKQIYELEATPDKQL